MVFLVILLHNLKREIFLALKIVIERTLRYSSVPQNVVQTNAIKTASDEQLLPNINKRVAALIKLLLVTCSSHEMYIRPVYYL